MARKSVLIISSLNPNEKIIEYIDNLIENDFKKIIIVNDGSKVECTEIFKKLKEKEECIVLNHCISLGKGRTLKDALNYYMSEIETIEYNGVVTINYSDNYLIEDIIKIDEAISKASDRLVLGTHDFDQKDVPKKSIIKNKTISLTLKLLYGKKIVDTQTGLRGIPNKLIPSYLYVQGEGDEYDTGILIESIKNKIKIVDVIIKGGYGDNGENSKSNSIKDFFMTYYIVLSIFFKYSISSLMAAFVDLLGFVLFTELLRNISISNEIEILLATILARIISSFVNYKLNKIMVFSMKERSKSAFFKYYVLIFIQMLCSAGCVMLLNKVVTSTVISKIIVDTILFFLSYHVQRIFIFKNKKQY